MTERERQAFIRGLSFEGEIEDRDGVLGFTVKKDFDLAAVFKGVYDPAADPPIQRINLGYCIADQMVWYSMELDFGRRDDGWDSMPRMFQLSDGEREYLKNEMDSYCLRQTGMPLLECLDVLADEKSVFGRQLSGEAEDSYVQAYTSYMVDTGRVDDTLDIAVRSSGEDEWFSCILTDEVRESLRQKLDTFCLLTYGEYLPVPPVQNNPAPLQMGPIM